MCVCLCERGSESVSVFWRMYKCACVFECVYECVSVCGSVCVRVCMNV